MNELKELRNKLGITQVEAASYIGVSRRTYQTYEETNIINDTFDDLLSKLNEMGVLDGSNYIPGVKFIKQVCNHLFKEQYPEISIDQFAYFSLALSSLIYWSAFITE